MLIKVWYSKILLQNKNSVKYILIGEVKGMKKQLLKTLAAGVLVSALCLTSCGSSSIKMIKIPGKDFKMSATEITQKQYEKVMGENPSWYQISNEFLNDEEKKQLKNTSNNPVESVSWYDAIYFCNKLSEKLGFTPVYAVDGKTDVATWNYTPHEGESIEGEISQNLDANGFRLPTVEEWQYAAKGGQNYEYSGSNNLDEVGWYEDNSGHRTHPVAQKKANGYGLYDMSGNVCEWCWDVYPRYSYCRYYCGGSYYGGGYSCKVDDGDYGDASDQDDDLGFRIVCSPFN